MTDPRSSEHSPVERYRAEGRIKIDAMIVHRQADGGVALGFGYTAEGVVDTKAREKTLWATGHRLLPSDISSPAVAAEFDVNGLQGSDASLVRPENTPPKKSYFIDYDNFFGDHQKSRSHG